MSFPQDQEYRKKLKSYVKDAVGVMQQIDTLKEDAKEISDQVKEELGMTVKEFKDIVKVAYNKAKIEAQIEQLQTSFSHAEILEGISEKETTTEKSD